MNTPIEAPRATRGRLSAVALTLAALAAVTLAVFLLFSREGQGPDGTARGAASDPRPASLVAAKGRVDVEGGLIRLAARHDGVIAAVLVEEGARVRAGQLLAALEDEGPRRGVELARCELRQARSGCDRAGVELAGAERELARLTRLAQGAAVARQDLDKARDAADLARIARRTAEAGADAALARLRVAERDLEERLITAPLDGVIVQRQARPGNGVSVTNVTPLFLFAPDGPRIVRAELEEQYIPCVHPGRRAEIILEADPSRRASGTVLRLGRVVGQRTPSDDPAEKQDNRIIEMVVTLDDQDLLVGQRVIVRFLEE